MLQEIINQKNNLHHAYLIEGDYKEIFPQIIKFLENDLSFMTKGNPDFWYGEFETFGIDDGRRINELQSRKAFSKKDSKFTKSDKKIFVIKTDFITREAQNSLLKMFEEPTPDTHFFIIMNSSEFLLPTLKSRLMLIKPYFQNNSSKETKKFTADFIAITLPERLKVVKKFFGDKKKKIPADKIGAIVFLNELEIQLRKQKELKSMKEKDLIIFEEIIRCRSYLNDRSPSVKMLLEHIALIV